MHSEQRSRKVSRLIEINGGIANTMRYSHPSDKWLDLKK